MKHVLQQANKMIDVKVSKKQSNTNQNGKKLKII